MPAAVSSLVWLAMMLGGTLAKVVMVPMMDSNIADIINDDTEEDMAKIIQTGEIPEALMNDILKEAGIFMNLYNVNPSNFLKRFDQQNLIH